MHRLYHIHSDTPLDPHSPVHVGFFGIPAAQLKSYNRALLGLSREEELYTSVARDLELSWPIRSGFWFLPYLLHAGLAVAIGATTGMWLLGIAYIVGMLSHAVQGGIINYFGHAIGGRTFDLGDNSKNNHLAAWLVLGEGFQNNHHRFPSSARFSYRWYEIDMGYAVCLGLEAIGVLEIQRRTLSRAHDPQLPVIAPVVALPVVVEQPSPP
jgi:stearoyl-CoA desaturase (delta-9 desaturase)